MTKENCCSSEHSNSKDDGFVLLEAIVATAISAAILALLFVAMTNLANSQEKITQAVKETTGDIFRASMVEKIIRNIRPVYIDSDVKFEGKQLSITAVSFWDDALEISGQKVELSLGQFDSEGQLLKIIVDGNVVETVVRVKEALEFSYIDHLGTRHAEWSSQDLLGIAPEIYKSNLHVAYVPSRIELLSEETGDLFWAFDTNAYDLPPRRPQDLDTYWDEF